MEDPRGVTSDIKVQRHNPTYIQKEIQVGVKRIELLDQVLGGIHNDEIKRIEGILFDNGYDSDQSLIDNTPTIDYLQLWGIPHNISIRILEIIQLKRAERNIHFDDGSRSTGRDSFVGVAVYNKD